jgi:DNA-binding NtrC family response regulator
MALGGKVDYTTVQGQPAPATSRASSRRAPDASVSKQSPSAPQILVVEDQDDVRRMLATALSLEGYDVDEAATAHDGLRLLSLKTYRLVVSDYAMPGGTGTWMLSEADRLGLMRDTSALIVTAHPDVRDLREFIVVNKPLDLDDLLDQVRRLVASTRIDSSAPASSARPRAKQKRT